VHKSHILSLQLAMNPQMAAQKGDIQILKRIGRSDPTALHQADANGWLPLHEAVRAGHIEAVQMILLNGGDINHMTEGTGRSPLDIALEFLGKEHDMTTFLRKNGGVTAQHPEL
jgi:ankyrin repeat protein